MLPLPRFATRPWFFGLLAILHVYMSGGHLSNLLRGPISWTDTWKGLGAIFAAYYFIALAVRPRSRRGAKPSGLTGLSGNQPWLLSGERVQAHDDEMVH